MAGWWEDYKKRKGLSSGGSESRTGKTYTERITTDEHRQAAKSSTWWEDYKKKNDLERKAADDRQRAVQTASRLKYRSERNQRFASANRQLDENRSRDATEDEIRELFRNPFLSDAEWQARVLQRNEERYKRDLPLYQQALQNASTWGEYFSTHRQAGESQSAVKHQFERYQQAAQNAEQERNESNLVNRPAQWQAENLSPQEIERRLAYYRSEAATPTVTDKDREARAYLYPEAALQKDPHGARFDERLVEDAGQDAVDAAYKPILTEQEKAAVEEADQQIIKEKAERNYEQVQRLLAAQKGQTEMFTRARGNQLMEEIATGGAAAKQVETGRAAFEAKQQQIASETSFEIGDDLDSNRGAYNKMQKERRERGYILGYDWDNVPEDRKQAVYALYAQDPEKAMELAKYYIADARQAEDEERQAWYAQSGWTAALGLVSSAAAHLGAAVDPFGEVGQELTRRGDNALTGGSQWADAATGYQKIPEWVPVVGGKGAGDLYQTVGSVVQSAAVAAPAILAGRYDQAGAEVLSKLGLALMGSSAAASDYRESVAAGMDEDRAKLHALAAGVEEALFEEVSLDKLIKMDTSGGLKAALKNWLVQSGIEGSEELATSIANRFTDEMISGAGQSKVERRASELIANGMNSTEAHTQAESEWMTDTLYDGFSGFLSGGMMTGGNYALKGLANLKGRAVSAVETRKAQKQAGAAVSRSEGSVEALQAYAKDKGIEIKAVETAEQNAGESAEQGDQEAKQNSYSSRDYRAISDTNSKVMQSIRNDLRGKTVQEQQAVRDGLVEKYGEGIAPVVNNAISIETATRVRQEYGDLDSIQTARSQAVKEIKDESLRRAVSDGYDSAAYSLAASQGGEDGMNTMSRYIQQRKNTGSGSEMSMNATVTAQDGSTKTISITGMSEDGKRVSLADGSEVAVKDLQADADTTSAIQQLADLDLGADATKVLQAYQQSGVAGTEGYRWLMDYATAYNQGRTRQISLEQAAQRSSLDERTVMDAYTLGQQAANRETLAGLEKLKNLPKRKGASGRAANIDTTEIKGKTMSKSEMEQFELANQYAQALGVDMVWFSSREQGGKFVDKNGAYENGKIYMDIHAGRNFAADLTSGILATMGHELSHFEQQYAPEEYQALKEFLFEQIVKSSPNGEARLERLIWEKQRRSGYTLSRKAAEDEVVADACQKMLRDSKAVHDFANQQPEAANGVVRWLDKWFKRVRSIFGRGGNYSEEAQIMDSLEQDVKAAFGELWDKALKQAVQVHDEVGNIGASTIRGIEETGASEQMAEEAVVQNSDRLDDETLRFLDNQEHVTVYRAMQMIDGKLYPPMAAKVEGKLVDATELGEWYQAVERPDLIDPKTGKWKLDKANGKAIKAAYNPYFHTSATPLNDQFSAAYKRPNIVVVEGIIPKSELTSGYKAQYAKDPVGETKWHAGPVASKLKGAKSRRVFLSRWFQAQRVVSDAEVADVVAKTLEGENIAVPNNVVTPSLLEALRERGVAIDEDAIDRFESKHGMRQNSDRDTEYLELAKDPEKNAARLQEMVFWAAIENRYIPVERYHQTDAKNTFTKFSTANPAAGKYDSETPNGIFLKTNDHFIPLGLTDTAQNTKQMPLFIAAENILRFADRTEANRWYCRNIKGYEALQDEMNEKLKAPQKRLDDLQNEWFKAAENDDLDAMDAIEKREDEVGEEADAIEKEYRAKQKKLLDDYFLTGKSAYDAIELKYDGHRYADGKREDVHTFIVFNPSQVKSADPVTYDDAGNVIPLSERFNPKNDDIRYSERDYSTPSDEELLMNAKVEDAANVEQGRELKDYQALGKRIATLEKQLAEAKRQTQLTNRALNTRGIGNVVKTVMKDYDITDARHNGTAKNATLALTDGYQKALDLLDKGASPAAVNDAVYNGAVKAAEIILEQGTYSQNLGGKWQTYSASRYLGENSQELIDSFVSEAYADFVSNRYREARPETAADRIVARTKKEAQERVDKYKGRSDALAEANRRLEEKTTQAETEAKEARKAAGELFLEIKDLRQELMDNKTMSEQERKAASKKLKSLNKSLEAKREEAANWQKRAKRNASLLKSALESKNRDISALNNRLSKEQAAALEKQKNLEAKLEKQIQRERDILAGKLRAPELVKMLKAEREKAEARVKKQKEQVFQNYKERKAATDLRGRISALKKDLQKSLLHPTDTNYVPAGLAKSIVDALDALDTSPREGTQSAAKYAAISDKLRAVAVAYNDMHTSEEVGYEYTVEYDQELAKMISDLAKTMEGRNARDLSADELKTVYDYLRSIRDTMVEARKLLSNLRYESVLEAIASGLEQQSKITPIDDVSKTERKKRLSVMDKRSPMRAVEFMSNMDRSAALYEAVQQVESGDEQRLAWSLAYQNDFRELKSGKNEKTYWQSLTKQSDYGATDKKTGKPVTMTKMQAIQLFMTAQREAANKDLEHFFKGGATIRNAKDIMEGKENIRSNEIFVTPELLKNIENSFTEWDREYMTRMRDYLKREGKAVNKVFYKLKHRVLALEENYVPTIVDQKYLDAKLETTDFSGLFVKSPRSTQAITKGAPQPLIIDGMETMMNKHVQEQAQYIGMATAIRDFAKIFNGKVSTSENGVGYTSLKAEIERNFGKKGVHLITQALIDIQGGSTQSGWRSGLEKVIKKLQTSFVRHALLFNLSVTIKQAASYVAAGSIISREALLKGNRSILNKNEASHSASLITQIFLNPNGKTAQKIFARADKYTALHADRRNGMNFAEIELGQKNYGKLRQKAAEIGANLEQKKGGHKVREIGAALNPASWIQRMDVATTAALFVACEYQARMDGLEGEAYHAKVKELYERVLRETQPMYDSLHRTAQQKSGGSLAQYLFPFRTVPIQNHGQMASAYDRLLAAKTKSDTEKAEAAKFFRKTLIAQIESAVVFSAMTFAAALTKRKTKKYRDEDGELTLESVARGFGLDVASTLVSVASPMWGSELWSLSDRFINKFTGKGGYTYDSFSVGALDMINDTAAAIDRIAADVGKAMRREDVSMKEFGTHMFSLLTKLGNLSGIPADTIKTYTEGFIGNIQDAIEGRIPALNDESWERDAATNVRRYLKAYLNNDTQKAGAVLAELRSNLSKSEKDEAKINEAIRKAVSAQAIEKVADGTWTEEEAEAYLLSTGAYDDRENPQKDAWNAIRKGVAKSTSTDEEYNWKQYDELAEAVANGEDVTGLLTEYRNHGYSDDQINAAIRSGIQEALTAGDLDGNEAADALIRYGVTYSKDGKAVAYDEQTAWKKVQEWADKAEHTDEEGELEEGYKYSAYADLFDAVDTNQNADGIIQTMVQNGGYDTDSLRSQIKDHLLERFISGEITETALKNQLARYCKITKTEDANEIVKSAKCKRDFGVSPDNLKEAFKDGDLSQNQAEKALQQYKGLSKTDAQNRVQYWGYDGDLSENAWAKWAHELKSTGLSVENWEKVYKVKRSAKGTDANGDGRADSGTVKAEVVYYIDGMNIPKSQKKAIYLAFGWAASTMPNWR